MTIGISKERLEEILQSNQCTFEREILDEIIKECTELNPWLPIDENTPKDRELWLYWESTGHMEKSYYNHMCGADCYATHYQELPGDPD